MTRVAIAGGGLAGLACAHKLRQKGIGCVVFEASSAAGGRGDLAPYLLGPDVYSNTFRLIGELGLNGRLRPIPPRAGQYYRGAVYRHTVSSATGLLGFQGLNIFDKAMLSRMAYLLAKFSSKLDVHRPELGAELDDESTAAFVKRELSQNILNYIAGPLISTLFFFASEETSKLLYLNIARHMHNTRMQTLAGGLSQIATALAKDVDVRLQTPVERVTTDESEYIVRGEKFSHLVIAVEGDRVLDIEGMKDVLSAADRSFFEACLYQQTRSLICDTDQPADGQCYAISIPRVEGMAAMTVAFTDFIDSASIPEGTGRLVVTGGGETTTGRLVEDVKRIYPSLAGFRVTQAIESKMAKFPPGRYRQIRDFHLRERRPGLLFCGDYWIGPFIEGAISSGIRTAEAIKRDE